MQGLRERGWEQLLLAPAGSPLAKRAGAEGIEVSELAPSSGLSLRNLSGLRGTAEGCDLLHAHDAHGHTLAWLAGAARRKPPWTRLVVSRRVAYPIGLLSRPKYWRPCVYIAVSEYVRRELLAAKIPGRKIRVVYDGVKPPCRVISAAERTAFRRHYGVADQTILLGTLTSLAPGKLVEAQVNALAALPPAVSLWVGRPAAEPDQESAEAALLEHARRWGIEKQVCLFALAEDLEIFLASLDVFVYLSDAEGLGSAILLAMAHRLPVIASGVGGIPEIVRDRETGLLVRGELTGELPPTIRLLMDSEPLRRRLGAAGREFVLAQATSDRMVARTAAVYEDLLRGSNTSSA
jgi:glycosyltransferase involved in cell wall biosynthesis